MVWPEMSWCSDWPLQAARSTRLSGENAAELEESMRETGFPRSRLQAKLRCPVSGVSTRKLCCAKRFFEMVDGGACGVGWSAQNSLARMSRMSLPPRFLARLPLAHFCYAPAGRAQPPGPAPSQSARQGFWPGNTSQFDRIPAATRDSDVRAAREQQKRFARRPRQRSCRRLDGRP